MPTSAGRMSWRQVDQHGTSMGHETASCPSGLEGRLHKFFGEAFLPFLTFRSKKTRQKTRNGQKWTDFLKYPAAPEWIQADSFALDYENNFQPFQRFSCRFGVLKMVAKENGGHKWPILP